MRPVLAGKTTGAQNILSRLVSSSLPITAVSQTLQKISLQLPYWPGNAQHVPQLLMKGVKGSWDPLFHSKQLEWQVHRTVSAIRFSGPCIAQGTVTIL